MSDIPKTIHHASNKPSLLSQLHRTDTRQSNTTTAGRRSIQHINARPHFRHAHLTQVLQQPPYLIRIHEIITRGVKQQIPNFNPVKR
jgi:hypothetical protein